jgi:hypothetical protein
VCWEEVRSDLETGTVLTVRIVGSDALVVRGMNSG